MDTFLRFTVVRVFFFSLKKKESKNSRRKNTNTNFLTTNNLTIHKKQHNYCKLD